VLTLVEEDEDEDEDELLLLLLLLLLGRAMMRICPYGIMNSVVVNVCLGWEGGRVGGREGGVERTCARMHA